MSVPRKAREYAGRVGAELSTVLGDDLVGLYLHGSAAMGGWHPELSDVDLLGVAKRGLSVPEKQAIARALQALPCPGAGLEFSLVTRQSLRDVPATAPVARQVTPPFELHITTGKDAKVVDGAGHRGDGDLVLHYAVCRERGVAVLGPPPDEVLPAVPKRTVLHQMSRELGWARTGAPARYGVLNACRAWAYAEEGKLLSKLEGGEWALGRYPSSDVIRAALAAQRGSQEPVDERDLYRLLDLVSHVLIVAASRA